MAMKDTAFGRWLLTTGADVNALAREVQASPKTLKMIGWGTHSPGVNLVRRLIRATYGALGYEDFYGDPLADPAGA